MRRLSQSRWLRWSIGLVISMILLYLAFRTTSFAAVWAVLRQADLWWVGAALVSVLATSLFKVVRWQVMLGPPGKDIPFLDLLMANLSGQMLNALFPVRVGDISRAVVIGGEGPGWAFVLGSVALEKIVDLLWYALLIVLLLVVIPLPGWVGDSIWVVLGAAVLMGFLTFSLTANRRRFIQLAEALARRWPSKASSYLVDQLRNGLGSLDVLQQRRDLVKIATWSTVIWSLSVLTNFFIFLSLGIHLSLSASILILVALTVGISVATVPGRIGVFEWICVLVLAIYSVGQTQALSYGLLLHAVVYIPMMLLGVISFLILTHGRRRQTASSLAGVQQVND